MKKQTCLSLHTSPPPPRPQPGLGLQSPLSEAPGQLASTSPSGPGPARPSKLPPDWFPGLSSCLPPIHPSPTFLLRNTHGNVPPPLFKKPTSPSLQVSKQVQRRGALACVLLSSSQATATAFQLFSSWHSPSLYVQCCTAPFPRSRYIPGSRELELLTFVK